MHKPFAESAEARWRLRRLAESPAKQQNDGDEMLSSRRKMELSNDKRFCNLNGKAERLLGMQPTLSNLAHLIPISCGTLVLWLLWTLLCAFKPHPYVIYSTVWLRHLQIIHPKLLSVCSSIFTTYKAGACLGFVRGGAIILTHVEFWSHAHFYVDHTHFWWTTACSLCHRLCLTVGSRLQIAAKHS